MAVTTVDAGAAPRAPPTRRSIGVGRGWARAGVRGFAALIWFLPDIWLDGSADVRKWAEFLCYATIAVGIDIAWGYGGMLVLGQGVFFGLGAYSMGMYLSLENMPERLGHCRASCRSTATSTALPWIWRPFDHLWFAVAAAVLVPDGPGRRCSGWLVFTRRRPRPVLRPAHAGDGARVLAGPHRQPAAHRRLQRPHRLHRDVRPQQVRADGTNLWLYRLAAVAPARRARARADPRRAAATAGCSSPSATARSGCASSATTRPLIKTVALRHRRRAWPGSPGPSPPRSSASSPPTSSASCPSILMVCWVAVGGRGTLWGAVARGPPRQLGPRHGVERPARRLAVRAGPAVRRRAGLRPGRHRRHRPVGARTSPAVAAARAATSRRHRQLPTASAPDARRRPRREPRSRATRIEATGVTDPTGARGRGRRASTSTASGPSTASTSPSTEASCASSSAPTAPARRRSSTWSPGSTKPTAGQVRLRRQPTSPELRSIRRVRLGIGRSFQTPTVFDSLTVVENLDLAASFRRPLPDAAAPAPGRVATRSATTLAAGRPRRPWPRRPAAVLSHGQKQWLEIGMLLVQEPAAAAARRAGGRHEPRGAAGTGALLARAGRRAHDRGHRARHGVPAALRPLGHRAARGTRPRRGHRSPRSRPTRRCARSTSAGRATSAAAPARRGDGGGVVKLEIDDLDRRLRAHRGAVRRRRSRSPDGIAGVRDGPQRRRQDHAAQRRDGAAAGRGRARSSADGVDLGEMAPYERARLGLGYVPQGHQVFPHLTAHAEPRGRRPRRPATGIAVIDEVLDDLPGAAGRCCRGRPACSAAARPSSSPSPAPW